MVVSVLTGASDALSLILQNSPLAPFWIFINSVLHTHPCNHVRLPSGRASYQGFHSVHANLSTSLGQVPWERLSCAILLALCHNWCCLGQKDERKVYERKLQNACRTQCQVGSKESQHVVVMGTWFVTVTSQLVAGCQCHLLFPPPAPTRIKSAFSPGPLSQCPCS